MFKRFLKLDQTTRDIIFANKYWGKFYLVVFFFSNLKLIWDGKTLNKLISSELCMEVSFCSISHFMLKVNVISLPNMNDALPT